MTYSKKLTQFCGNFKSFVPLTHSCPPSLNPPFYSTFLPKPQALLFLFLLPFPPTFSRTVECTLLPRRRRRHPHQDTIFRALTWDSYRRHPTGEKHLPTSRAKPVPELELEQVKDTFSMLTPGRRIYYIPLFFFFANYFCIIKRQQPTHTYTATHTPAHLYTYVGLSV